jgi:tRNA A37 threonylcarbamoyladenosine modification protein TsaB
LATVTSGATSVLPEQGPLARDLLPLALSELDRGTAATLETALPVYLRREEAWRR